MTTKFRWHKSAIATGVGVLLSVCATGAMALTLGRVTVQSALGEPLRAEIEVTDINEEEAVSLRASVAGPETYKAAGLPYNPAMAEVSFALGRRADGRTVIKVASPRSINETFVDLILEANWSSGRVVRDYTMMFDPPPPGAASGTEPVRSPAQGQASSSSASARQSAQKPVVKPQVPGDQQVVVKAGDTASKIARLTKTDDVTLDQMMVALVQSNPDAFSQGNVNRLRAGAVLDLPSAEDAKAISSGEASRMVVAQGKAFNEFRRKLATNTPKATEKASDRQAGGKLDTGSGNKNPQDAAPDKLTLSKGAMQGSKENSKEAKIAQELAEKEAAARAAELAKNIADLNKLNSASAAKTPADKASAAQAPAAAAAASQAASSALPSVTVATAPLPEPAASEAPAHTASAPAASAPAAPAASAPEPAASAPAEAASAPASAAPAAPKASEPQTDSSTPMPAEAPGIVGELLADPVVPVTGGLLVALVGGVVLYLRQKRKKKQTPATTPSAEAKEPVADAAPAAEKTLPHELMGNTDPLAEADLYMGYGHDVQAEDILKDAIQKTPGRVVLHLKLLEIYAKRSDKAAFEGAARQVFKLTGASGEWAQVCEAGSRLDPDNPLYQSGSPSEAEPAPRQPAPQAPPRAAAPAAPAKPDAQPLAFDLNSLSLDLSAPDTAQEDAPSTQDQIKTKLALADEFIAIDDTDGARALLEEVVAETTGSLRAQAQSALDALNFKG